MTVATAIATNPILGAKRIKQTTGELLRSYRRRHRGPHGLPLGTEIWQVSHELQDLREHAFVAGRDVTEIVAALEAQHPAGHPLLTRVEGVALQPEWTGDKFVYPDPLQYLVHVHPLLDMTIAAQKLGGGAGPKDVLQALAGAGTRVATLEALAGAHGPVLMHRDEAEHLRTENGFEESSIVVAEFTGTDYALVKFAPSKAKARRTRRHNETSRCEHAAALARAVAGMRTRIDALSRALIDDLASDGSFLRYALVDRGDSRDVDAAEPMRSASRRHHGAGWRWRSSTCSNSEEQPLKCLARLYALGKIHEKFRGRRAYRRLPQWAALREQYRKLPDRLDPERWGCWTGPLTAFLESEMKARAPRLKAPVRTDEGCDGGRLHHGSSAQAVPE